MRFAIIILLCFAMLFVEYITTYNDYIAVIYDKADNNINISNSYLFFNIYHIMNILQTINVKDLNRTRIDCAIEWYLHNFAYYFTDWCIDHSIKFNWIKDWNNRAKELDLQKWG